MSNVEWGMFNVKQPPSTWRTLPLFSHSPFAFTIHHSPFTIHHSPLTLTLPEPLGVQPQLLHLLVEARAAQVEHLGGEGDVTLAPIQGLGDGLGLGSRPGFIEAAGSGGRAGSANFWWQVVLSRHGRSREEHGTLHGPAELPHVARPPVAAEGLHDLRGEVLGGPALPLPGLGREARGQERDVLRALAEGWNVEGEARRCGSGGLP